MESVIEAINWPEHGRLGQNYDYVRGYILRNVWSEKPWTAIVLSYGDDPPDANSFKLLRDARRWAFNVLRKRNKISREEDLMWRLVMPDS